MNSMTAKHTMRSSRVRFDPNDLAPGHTGVHLAFMSDADGPVFEGEIVVAVQAADEEGEPNLVGSAQVVRVDYRHGLIYLNVMRGSFRQEAPSDVAFPDRTLVSSNTGTGVLTVALVA